MPVNNKGICWKKTDLLVEAKASERICENCGCVFVMSYKKKLFEFKIIATRPDGYQGICKYKHFAWLLLWKPSTNHTPVM